MPIKPHPTDPDKMVLVRGEYIPPKEWVGLTNEEHMEILTRDLTAPSRIAVAEAILKEKNK